MSVSKKPRTALAKLLDTMREADQLRSTSVVIPEINLETHSTEAYIPAEEENQKYNDLKLEYLDPNECQPWQFADRPEDEMGDIEQLAESLRTVGQQEPVLVRMRHKGQGVRYEIIFGNRRWRAAKLAKIKLLAIVKSVSDQDAALYQTEENEARKDLSDLARAKSYKAQLDAGVFASEAELSKKLLISRKTLNDIMAFIRIPEELATAIPNFKYISRTMAVKLALLAKDKILLPKLISLADKIGKKTVNSTNIERFIHEKVNQLSKETDQEMIVDQYGKPLFLLKKNTRGQTIIQFYGQFQEKKRLSELKKIIYEYLINST